MNKQQAVITLDGPSGTGKGTISQQLAKHLGWHLLDSGALYRVLALASSKHGIDVTHEAALAALAQCLDVEFSVDKESQQTKVILEGSDCSEAIRTEQCGIDASKVAALPQVRAALLDRQAAFLAPPGLVCDGRDMGTVVFPDAFLKIYLDASVEVRAKRRYLQLKQNGINANLAQVVKELTLRDERDSGRSVAPLKPASDAKLIDTTTLSVEQVLDKILSFVELARTKRCTTE